MNTENYEHYNLGSEEHKAVDGWFKRVLDSAIITSSAFIGNYDLDKNVTEPSLKGILEIYRKEIVPTFGEDERVKKLYDHMIKVMMFLINRDSYHRERFFLLMYLVQKKRPIQDVTFKLNCSTTLRDVYYKYERG